MKLKLEDFNYVTVVDLKDIACRVVMQETGNQIRKVQPEYVSSNKLSKCLKTIIYLAYEFDFFIADNFTDYFASHDIPINSCNIEEQYDKSEQFWNNLKIGFHALTPQLNEGFYIKYNDGESDRYDSFSGELSDEIINAFIMLFRKLFKEERVSAGIKKDDEDLNRTKETALKFKNFNVGDLAAQFDIR